MMSRALCAALATILVLGMAACGREETERPEPSVTARSDQLRRCLRAAGLALRRDPPATGADRVAIRVVPATHLGVVVFANRSYADLWMARTREDARRAAELLHAATPRQPGFRGEAASAQGFAVMALAGSGALVPTLEEARAVDRCVNRVSR